MRPVGQRGHPQAAGGAAHAIGQAVTGPDASPGLGRSRRWLLRLRAGIDRIIHHEYWPAWVFYAPLLPYLLWLGLRHRSLLCPTALNPGIEHGGGIVGESKHAIMKGLGSHAAVLATTLIEPGHADRRLEIVRSHAAARGGWPIILKPDQGQRGFAVTLVRTEAKARRYLETVTGPVVAQPFHAGPHECGVLWARDPQNPQTGFIFSVTRKEFPTIDGDGVHTLQDLILLHPRHRRQARVFLERLGQLAARVPALGERVSLGVCGNHCQGALFRDGADLVTPALVETINAIAMGFRGVGGGGLDFGRFDIRYRSEQELREGRGMAIVELNGITSESTNMYDPTWSVWRSYATLFAQWRLMYKLGRWRRSQGAKVTGLGQILRWWRMHRAERSGSAVSS